MTISAYAIPGIKDCDRDIFTPAGKAEMIIKKVCRFYGLNDLQVRSKSREHLIVKARMFCMYFIRMKTGLSLKATGMLFSGRDHTTCMNAVAVIKEQISFTYPNAFKQDYQQLIQII